MFVLRCPAALSLAVGLLFSTIALMAQIPGDATPGAWLSARKLADGVWLISDHYVDNMYLVEGNDKALLIDTGLGVARLNNLVKTLTSKPVMVVNTHGHPDHAAGNYQFKAVHAHPADFDAVRQVGTKESRQRMAQSMARGAAGTDIVPIEEAAGAPQAQLLPVKDGFIFDLGGRKLEVIETPGHTSGEIVLLDAANRLLFTGDNNVSLVWLFLPASRPLEVYLESLKKLQKHQADIAMLYPGHGAPLPAALIGDQIGCVERILNGTAESKPQHYLAGEAMVATYRTASVAYNPKNLRAKK